MDLTMMLQWHLKMVILQEKSLKYSDFYLNNLKIKI